MQPFVRHHNALLLANHGAVTYGATLWQAFDRMETLEHTARITILARSLGGGRALPADAIKKLINVREAAGYLGEQGRCQSCGYLEETNVTCSLHDAPDTDTSRLQQATRSSNGQDRTHARRTYRTACRCRAHRLKNVRSCTSATCDVRRFFWTEARIKR
jgi:hypothetical protein